MTKTPHGNYDLVKHLPNNTGQPNESGLCIWLLEQASLLPGGADLVAHCRHVKGDRYHWLLEQLLKLDTAESKSLVEQYDAKKKYLAAESRQRQRIRDLRGFEKLFIETGHVWHEKKAKRIQNEINKAQERWQFPPLE